MDELPQEFEKEYERVQAHLSRFSEEWKHHANRRTIIISVLVGALSTAFYWYAIRPPDSFPTDQLVSVDSGQSVAQIASTLQKDGVIRSALLFRAIVTVLGRQRELHAGDYLFKEPVDVFSVARRVSLGQYGLEPLRIRIPEGATTKEMAAIFRGQLQRFDPSVFLSNAAPEEGYLFPDTYFFLPNATADTILAALRQNFDTQEATIESEIKTSGHSLADIVTMASILEREGRATSDRRLIAGVLWRRLRLGMALQADATMTYVLDRGKAITPKVLATDSPYNTYLHKGLPPTPIGSPSLSSLEAAATPIDKGYLFYLADSRGVTHYCKTYACQLSNERTYFGR